jgi:sterol desaturase/sphingolipid hydroxylase (fatty acid hydroxylase superfamily)
MKIQQTSLADSFGLKVNFVQVTVERVTKTKVDYRVYHLDVEVRRRGMTNRDVWNIVLITLAVIGAVAVIGFIGMALMSMTMVGMMGGMMNCGVGMAGGWLVGLLLIATIVAAVVLLLRRRSQH